MTGNQKERHKSQYSLAIGFFLCSQPNRACAIRGHLRDIFRKLKSPVRSDLDAVADSRLNMLVWVQDKT